MNMITNHCRPPNCSAGRGPPLAPLHRQGGAAPRARGSSPGEGVWLTDSEGHRIIDGMAGLWCVNIGYGRKELAQVAARQMEELAYYNTFFQTTHVPAIALAAKIAEACSGRSEPRLLRRVRVGSERHQHPLVRRYWDVLGSPEKRRSSRGGTAIMARPWAAARLAG
jgi:putrescine aminotransferase